MKIQVRKCRFTGKIFEEKDLKKYAIHLERLREDRATKKRLDRVRSTFHNWLREEKKGIASPQDIPEWFLKNQRNIMDAVNSGLGDRREKFYNTDEFIKFEFSNLRYTNLVSNTHVCPDNGVTNWHSSNDKPKGYPGWNGHVSGVLSRKKTDMCSYPYGAALNVIGLKTGSGGGGNDGWGYEVSIFLDDWPELSQQHVFDKLMGTV